jgi:hypothetical protein
LLLQGTKLLDDLSTVEIKLGNSTFKSSDNKTEAGTGYFKKTINGNMVEPEMGNVFSYYKYPISQSTNWSINQLGFGLLAVFLKILTRSLPLKTPLKLSKKLFIEKNTDRGPVLTPINERDYLKVGDKIKCGSNCGQTGIWSMYI